MNILLFILSTLSLIAILMAIVFEGMFKSDNPQKISIKSFFIEFRKLSIFGWILIGISILLGIGNGFISIKTIRDNKLQFEQDTIKFKEIISQLKIKGTSDSIKIENLKDILKINGIKSDSIKLTLVDNAVKAMEEQRRNIERERENTFSHFQKEIEENLRKILINYEENHIKGFSDTTMFISTRLNNMYIKEYELISSNKIIIDYLMEVAEKIDKVNMYAEKASEFIDKPTKRGNVRMFLANVELVKPDLLEIYKRIIDLKSYQQYERTNFDKSQEGINNAAIENFIRIKYMIRENQIK